MLKKKKTPRVLTIAGSDSGGGAGIQADLKTISALNCYGMSAITAITAQNTIGVSAVHPIPPDIVKEQIEVVMQDIGADAIKTGMLWGSDTIRAIHDALSSFSDFYLVIDPVLVAKSGDLLLQREALETLLEFLVPQAWIITPNLPELRELTGIEPENEESLLRSAEVLLERGARYVLVKGGHANGKIVTDWLISNDGNVNHFLSQRIDTKNTHGTGCTLSSAIACYLAHGLPTITAVERAIQFVHKAIETAPSLGHGHGPLNHLWRNKPI
ncbi:MAG TPA: bifunctional hydroxymethylpyrimidine kinase/phosphomethylpyrimidine kinase [Candidatus Hydrogenedens sp.]|nr:bifunctional hydroxymethylpyrimidine kinase/phosphomethylpyrimidine kinase [Candidatus Hydrogenedens sp.]HOL20525.1 bifunctional hydroxymethylpyrimidine kinase/phosphomethylpyrimidine kinase [Candidatus Hydrogenedens sp.]HPP58817.1 bifunctional hydroxymethylpyrimidine kinase/phosphomethylpyrimidine kinase [Candidatus Hydrogenedens sp.]